MLCNKLYFAILTLALSYTAQAAPQGFEHNHRRPKTCPPPVTVTVTARGGVQTGNNLIGNNTKTASAAGSSATSAANNGDPQKSLTLDPKVIATGFENNGQDVPTPGQVASLTSGNNFINFCLTVPNLPITNGKQITTGSCNPAPMGVIPSVQNMVSAKVVFPTNFGAVKANTPFTIKIAIQGMNTGFFVNAQTNYYAAPQQVDPKNGRVNGHSHIVVEQLQAIDQTTPTDPTKFVFFKGLNDAAAGGILSVALTNGLPAGVYRAATINTAANHQPFLGPVAQHGSFDDQTYFQVTADGKVAGVAGAASASNSATSAASATGGAAKGTATGADTGAKGAATGASTDPAGKGAQPTPPAQKANNSNDPATPTPAKSSPTTAASPGAKGGKTN